MNYNYSHKSAETSLQFSNGVKGVLKRRVDHEIERLIRKDYTKHGVQPEFIEIHLKDYCSLIIEFYHEKVQFICSNSALNDVDWSCKEKLEHGELSVLEDSTVVDYIYYKGDLYSFYFPYAPTINPHVKIFITAAKNKVSPNIASLLS